MKKLCSFLLFGLFFLPFALRADPSSDSLSQLLQGNDRYVQGKSQHASLAAESKNPQMMSDRPRAIIVGCSDARVPPEIIFDQGLGDLFVIRVAGNVVGPIELDSVEFAVAKMNVPLVIVLGHEGCKAVQATLKGRENVPELDAIYPLIDKGFKQCGIDSAASLMKAIDCNVQRGVTIIKNSPTLAPYITQKKVRVMGAYYDINNGKVTVNPSQ